MAPRKRELKSTILALCSFLLCARQLHGAANIDTIQFIVRTSPDKVAEDDYGYAVVLHQIGVPAEGNFEDALDNTRIIVGAPKGTYPGGTALPVDDEPVSMTGLVYTCPVNQGNCSGLLGDPSYPNYQRLFDGESDSAINTTVPRADGSFVLLEENEYKSGQLMGATLQSSGTHFLVCAPRYQTNGTFRLVDNRRPVGRCFISERELRNFTDYRPCRGGNRVVDVIGDSQCLTGIGATLYVDENNRTLAALGAVGDRQYDGTIFLYNVTGGDNSFKRSQSPAIPTSYLYEGYSVASGKITGNTSPDFLVGVPRYDGSLYTGSAFVRNEDSFENIEMSYNLTGETIGEYYGWSVATADLNGDGFDEILVGAPVFSLQTKAEVGRVYVYKNNRDGTVDSPVRLEGQAAKARFGTSIINLGDVNGDNFDDVAIGAPYHKAGGNNTGAVYIYYGNLNGEIISTTPNQIINASSVVDRVDNLNELRSFGYSLSSGVDVDNNAYNDLLVGAYESKTAVLFRTLSIAQIVAAVSVPGGANITIDGTMDGIDFDLRVCASYSGRGLDGRPLATTLIVREVGTSNRLTFDGESEHRGEFVFDTTDAEKCEMVTVTIKSLSRQPASVDVTTPYEVVIEFEQFERTPTNGIEELVDLRDSPLLLLEGITSAMVTPIISCAEGRDPVRCNADIQLSPGGLQYRASPMGPVLTNRESVVAGQVQFVDVRLNYVNTGFDPAFGTVLKFQIPEHFARQATVRFDPMRENPIMCGSDGKNYSCVLDNYLPVNEPSTVVVQLSVVQNPPILGNEDSVMFTALIDVNADRTDEENETDNSLSATISFSAIAELLVNFVTLTGPMDYGTTLTGDVNSVSDLGRRVTLRATVTNNGPSINPSAQLNISFPVGTSSAHFYVFDIRSPDFVVCSSQNFDFNRQNLTFGSPGARRRRAAQLNLAKRQDAQIETNVNCSNPATRDTSSCANVVCTITDFTVMNVIVDILAVVDRRFFDSRSETFTYTSYASVRSLTDFVRDTNRSDDSRRSMPFRLGPSTASDDGNFPIWIPIVCAIAALILIIILFVLLYFFGFFRRKRVKEQEAEGDFEVREVPPEGQGTTAGGPGLAPIDEKGDIGEEVLPEKNNIHNDIGDAHDLQDGEITEPQKEPEETSL